MRSLIILMLMLAGTAQAEGERAGDFDYYVLSLSWSPNWCAREGNARRADQCDPGAGHGWTLHGLWPQYDRGWPSYCPTARRAPSRPDTAAMADIMGSGGLAWHQWNKHGRCTGLSSDDYYTLSREAYEAVTRPEAFRKFTGATRLPARVVEKAFLAANPDLEADMLTVTCKSDQIQEVRICLTPGLEPRRCGEDTIRDCTQSRALMVPIP